jgi:small conductance mechanosensitive channel
LKEKVKGKNNMEDFKISIAQLITSLVNYVPRAVSAIVILLSGIWIIRLTVRKLRSALVKGKLDNSWAPFFTSSTNAILYILLILSVASIVGIETTSFIAVLGAIGLAIGLALQGSFSNFAGGMMILLFKPLKIGEYIQANGVIGQVTEIQLFQTTLKTYDNKIIILPNGLLSNNMIINFSRSKTRLVEWVFSIGYEDNIELARKLINDEIFTDSRILNKTNPFISITALTESTVNITVRAEVKQNDYWDVLYLYFEKVKVRFDKEGIHFPFPQREVHIIEGKPENKK